MNLHVRELSETVLSGEAPRQTLRNRIVFGAHTTNMSDMGLPGPRHIGYYEERARGGAAMIVIEPMPGPRGDDPDPRQFPVLPTTA